MKRKIALSVIVITAVIFCMVTIYNFSAQGSVISNDISRSFTEKIAGILFQNFTYMNADIQNIIIIELNLFIRKAAHFSVFFTMSFFVYMEAVIWLKKYLLSGIISVMFCVVYAIADEYHQSFSPGRTPLLKDVFIDTAGALLGAITCFVLISVVLNIKNTMQKNNSSQPSASLSDS